tara:strand:+ start:896 stop:2206 length:1311 start_codon:yes stop_codon:yes gene_type:complete
MKFKKLLHITILVIFFFRGVFELTGFYPRMINFIALALITILFGATLFRKNIRLPYFFTFVALGVVCIISGPILNDISLTNSFFFFRQLLLLQYMYLVIIVNETDDDVIRTIYKTILLLFIIQIPANFIKYILVGTAERYIGTMSVSQGSLTTIFTLFAIAFLFSKYLYTKDKKLILYMFLFLMFNAIGIKRATFVYLPIIMFIISIYYIKITNLQPVIIIRSVILLGVISFAMTYTILRMNPDLNKEAKVGGSFDIKYAMEFVREYNQQRGLNLNQYGATIMSRPQALIYMYDYLLKQDMDTILFGEGAGKLSPKNVPKGVTPLSYYYGISYGGRMGIVWIFIQVGLIGVIIFLYLMVKMLFYILKFKPATYHNWAFLGIWMVVMLDLLTYSPTFIDYFVINGTFFFFFGLFYRDKAMKRNFLSNTNPRIHLKFN